MTGYFIAFEGGEGVGKSTQEALLADYLTQQGHVVLRTREPGAHRPPSKFGTRFSVVRMKE